MRRRQYRKTRGYTGQRWEDRLPAGCENSCRLPRLVVRSGNPAVMGLAPCRPVTLRPRPFDRVYLCLNLRPMTESISVTHWRPRKYRSSSSGGRKKTRGSGRLRGQEAQGFAPRARPRIRSTPERAVARSEAAESPARERSARVCSIAEARAASAVGSAASPSPLWRARCAPRTGGRTPAGPPATRCAPRGRRALPLPPCR